MVNFVSKGVNLSRAFCLIARNLTKLCDPYKTLDYLGATKKMKSNRCKFGLAGDLIVSKLSKPLASLSLGVLTCKRGTQHSFNKYIWHVYHTSDTALGTTAMKVNKKDVLLALIELITRCGC